MIGLPRYTNHFDWINAFVIKNIFLAAPSLQLLFCLFQQDTTKRCGDGIVSTFAAVILLFIEFHSM